MRLSHYLGSTRAIQGGRSRADSAPFSRALAAAMLAPSARGAKCSRRARRARIASRNARYFEKKASRSIGWWIRTPELSSDPHRPISASMSSPTESRGNPRAQNRRSSSTCQSISRRCSTIDRADRRAEALRSRRYHRQLTSGTRAKLTPSAASLAPCTAMRRRNPSQPITSRGDHPSSAIAKSRGNARYS